jgi:membrane-associated protease RseP (regulator of RpoE activity)
MDLLIGVLIFLPFLTFIIAVHEGGHFIAARHFGMKVTEYFIGFGAWKIWARRKGELEYGVKPIWIGGYVKIAGMNPYESDPPEDAPRLYGARPIWQRAITIFAGPGTHFVLAALIFAAGFYFFGNGGPRGQTRLTVGSVDTTLEGRPAPAQSAGLQAGDVIVAVDGIDTPSSDQLVAALSDLAEEHPGQPAHLRIVRDGETSAVSVTPVVTEDEAGNPVGRIGIQINEASTPVRMNIVSATVHGVEEVGYTIADSIRQIGRVFSPSGIGRTFGLLFNDDQRDPTRDPTSVVGVSQAVGVVGSAGAWALLFYLFGFVTVFVGLINLVPLPPFDGGHLLVLAIEKIRGKAVDMRKLIPVSAAVMAFFVMFVAATVLLDFTKPIVQ